MKTSPKFLLFLQSYFSQPVAVAVVMIIRTATNPFTPTNAVAASNGATITPTTASNLIDGDVTTSWTSNDSPVVISFGAVKK